MTITVETLLDEIAPIICNGCISQNEWIKFLERKEVDPQLDQKYRRELKELGIFIENESLQYEYEFPYDGDLYSSSEVSPATDVLNLYLADIRKYPVLTAAEEKELWGKIKKGDEKAREKMILCNLRFCVKIAKSYLYSNLGFMDLIQEANLGLIMAVKNFCPDKGRLCSYAKYWIDLTIIKAIQDKSMDLQMPRYLAGERHRVKQAMAKLEQRGEPITVEALKKETELPEKKIILCLRLLIPTISLNEAIKDADKSTLMDNVPDSADLEKSYIAKEEQERIRAAVKKLPPKKREIICLRYGINNDGVCYKYRDIATKFGISVERVRQICKEAEFSLRNSYCDEISKFCRKKMK